MIKDHPLGLSLTNALANLTWARISRRPAPSDGARAGDTTYGVRSSEDMARAVRRQALKDGKTPPAA